MNLFKYYRAILIITLTISLFCSISYSDPTYCEIYELELCCPYWYMLFNRAGYMDITYWYPSERHEDGPHEMCTGDVAIACWYQGIKQGSNLAQWLTNWFEVPDFWTYTPFVMGNKSASNNPYNPVWTDPCQPTGYVPGSHPYSIGATGNDTGWSDVSDGKLQVKIYYEVADLGQQDANTGVGGSPMSFRDANNNPVFCYSDRYIQTLINTNFNDYYST